MGRDLMSFLIMPIQRLPRYEMLLRELLKHSAEEDMSVKLSGQQVRAIDRHFWLSRCLLCRLTIQALDKIIAINQAGES